MPPGTYTVVVTLLGYEAQRIEGIRVVAGETTLVGAQLVASAFQLNPVVVSASKRQEKALDAPASVAVVDSRAVRSGPVTRPSTTCAPRPASTSRRRACSPRTSSLRGFNNIFSGSLHALTDNRIAGVPSLRVNLLHFIPATNEDIDRMEVVLGPGAALYGPNTADGVLHIITKSPLDAQGTSISLAAGRRACSPGRSVRRICLSENFGVKISGQYLQAEEWAYDGSGRAGREGKFIAADRCASCRTSSTHGDHARPRPTGAWR